MHIDSMNVILLYSDHQYVLATHVAHHQGGSSQ
jgi:hypothetical protein